MRGRLRKTMLQDQLRLGELSEFHKIRPTRRSPLNTSKSLFDRCPGRHFSARLSMSTHSGRRAFLRATNPSFKAKSPFPSLRAMFSVRAVKAGLESWRFKPRDVGTNSNAGLVITELWTPSRLVNAWVRVVAPAPGLALSPLRKVPVPFFPSLTR